MCMMRRDMCDRTSASVFRFAILIVVLAILTAKPKRGGREGKDDEREP